MSTPPQSVAETSTESLDGVKSSETLIQLKVAQDDLLRAKGELAEQKKEIEDLSAYKLDSANAIKILMDQVKQLQDAAGLPDPIKYTPLVFTQPSDAPPAEGSAKGKGKKGREKLGEMTI